MCHGLWTMLHLHFYHCRVVHVGRLARQLSCILFYTTSLLLNVVRQMKVHARIPIRGSHFTVVHTIIIRCIFAFHFARALYGGDCVYARARPKGET